jgi:hypothetical protein
MNKTKSPRRINTCSYKVAIGKLHRAVELNEMCCPSFSSFLIEMMSTNLRNCGLLPNLRWHRGRLSGRTRQRELQSHTAWLHVPIGSRLCEIPEESDENESSGFGRDYSQKS